MRRQRKRNNPAVHRGTGRMQRCLLSLALALTVAGAAAVRASAQQPDTTPGIHRVLQRFDGNTTVRLRFGRRFVSGQVTRLTPDSAYVQGFDWPEAVPLARVDSVWQRIPGDQHWRGPALLGAATGVVAGALLGAGLCGYDDAGHNHNCTFAPVVGGISGGLLLGSVGAFFGGLISTPAHWERRFP